MHNSRSKEFFVQTAVVAALTFYAGDAMAQQSLGGVMDNTTRSLEDVPNLLSMLSYICGLVMAMTGVFKLQAHVNGVDKPGAPPPLSDSVKRFIAGGAFLTAPYMSEVVYNSAFGNGQRITSSTAISGSASGNGLDAMVVRAMSDISGPIQNLLAAFCYIFAIGFLLIGISRLTKRAEDGPRGPAGMGTIMTFITASALFAFGDMMGAFSSSLFGDNEIATRVTLADIAGVTGDDAEKIQTVIQSVMAFVMIVGFIAFIRGWFVLRAFADGNQGATMAQGLTFLFGGALAINLGELVNAIQKTVGVTGFTFS